MQHFCEIVQKAWYISNVEKQQLFTCMDFKIYAKLCEKMSNVSNTVLCNRERQISAVTDAVSQPRLKTRSQSLHKLFIPRCASL